jgi:cytoskeletal protein RodZ
VNEEKEKPEGSPEPEQLELGGETTVGELLLDAREKKGLTLEAVSQETKIPVMTLQYLETDNFEAIPAKVYATGFLKAYSQILGLDPMQVINKYEVQTGQTHKSKGDLWEIEEEIVEEKLGSTHLLGRFIIPSVLAIIVIIILVKVFSGGDEGEEPIDDKPATEQQVKIDDSEAKTDRPVSTENAGDAGEGPDEEKLSGVEDESGGGAAMEESQADSGVEEVSEPSRTSGEMILSIYAEEKIWFDVVIYTRTTEGVDSFETDFILEAGESRTFTSNESFLIRKIGKAEGFAVELDGRPYVVPIVEGRLPRDIIIKHGE